MPRVGLEHMLIVFERAKTFRALDGTAEKQIACRETMYFCCTCLLLLCWYTVQNSLIIYSVIKRLERRSLSEPRACGYI